MGLVVLIIGSMWHLSNPVLPALSNGRGPHVGGNKGLRYWGSDMTQSTLVGMKKVEYVI